MKLLVWKIGNEILIRDRAWAYPPGCLLLGNIEVVEAKTRYECENLWPEKQLELALASARKTIEDIRNKAKAYHRVEIGAKGTPYLATEILNLLDLTEKADAEEPKKECQHGFYPIPPFESPTERLCLKCNQWIPGPKKTVTKELRQGTIPSNATNVRFLYDVPAEEGL